MSKYKSKNFVLSSTGISILLLVASFLSNPVYAAGPDVFELAPGVIVDRAGSVVYTMHPDRGVEASSLDSGSRIWLSNAAEKPFWVDGNTVYAQSIPEQNNGNLHIAFLSVSDGGVKPQNLEVSMPFGVIPLIDERRGKRFSFHVQGENQALFATWDYLDQSTMPKPWPDAPPPRIISEKGAALLDPVAQSAELVSPATVSARARAPAAVGLLLDSGALKEPFWLAETFAANVVDQPLSGSDRQILLQRWEAATGAEQQSVTLFEGRRVSGRASADQQHYLVASRSDEMVAGVLQYRWQIFSMASGEAVGEIQMNRSNMPFNLSDGRLMLVSPPFGHLVNGQWADEPPRVRVLDLQSGREIWSKPVRDTLYRGPVPSNRGGQ